MNHRSGKAGGKDFPKKIKVLQFPAD